MNLTHDVVIGVMSIAFYKAIEWSIRALTPAPPPAVLDVEGSKMFKRQMPRGDINPKTPGRGYSVEEILAAARSKQRREDR